MDKSFEMLTHLTAQILQHFLKLLDGPCARLVQGNPTLLSSRTASTSGEGYFPVEFCKKVIERLTLDPFHKRRSTFGLTR